MRKNRIFAIGLLTAAVIGGAGCSAQPDSASAKESTQIESSAQTEESSEADVIETVEGTIESLEETKEQTLSPVLLQGSITRTEDGSLMIDSQPGGTYTGEVILNISDDTLILDGVNGYPVQLEDLKDGSMVYAYVGPAMTMSLPPMTTAELILCEIPEDAKAPEYVEVKSVVSDAESGDAVLTTVDGVEYEIDENCQILPYLTRNIVTLSDLTEGSRCLIWSDAQNRASKIVLFAAE